MISAIKNASNHGITRPTIIEIHRASIHNGRLPFESNNPGALAEQMKILTRFAIHPSVVALGVQTDISFNGLYDDLESVKKTSELPVICNDFVMYGYQLFRVLIVE